MTANPLTAMGQAAREASFSLLELGSAAKNALLTAIRDQLLANQTAIIAANDQDMALAKANGLEAAMLDRLLLNEQRLSAICADIDTVIGLADPVGEELESRLLDNGMRLSQRRIPLGVIGVIYEARPNVTVDIAVLALKTGNAAILRGGKETMHSNRALLAAIHTALESHNLPKQAVQLIDSPDRALVSALLQMDDYVDMLIPRGGSGLHQLCKQQARMPVITGGIGICHMFVDKDAQLDKVSDLVINAKVQRPTVCNALDTLLVHVDVAKQVLPLIERAMNSHGVVMKACPEALPLLPSATTAGVDDFDQEWLGLTLGVKVVADVNGAISHIRTHSSDHSESILTDNISTANRFIAAINSAAVYVNASTRFTDGSEFGLGAEVAVSTQKLHARGPMGLSALTTYKWLGQADYLARS
ncbi:glutamate-5-semialdehyde dehydrogenase [Ferrimonas lipolytica]|uniref:Gamma-glutamyl phosphate reductase n=1 Tax=Ferrimonas lipolytica TaxID=2724191 RepID=A0A6H1UE81_9GAMM|nr:glutamate-5-semialdehyde dehydrogenase [Ferrimonas lipolytica]QIZ77417.1 glutamate-5-semialdehyde dehydrogenase [Ferrimonas lipolytica]